MKANGPYVRNDVDRYEESSGVYWAFWIFWFIYAVLFFVYVAVFINNVSFLYTYTYNPGAPGVLTSLRYSFQWVLVMMTCFANLLILLLLPLSVMYRYDYGCTITTWIFYVLSLAMLLFAMIGLATFYTACNGQDQYGNLCNDLRWCCVDEIFMNVDNRCPNTLGCTPPVTLDELSPESTFLGLFWLTFIFVLFNVVYTIVALVGWCGKPPLKSTPKVKVEEEEELPVEVAASTRKLLAGLRERKK